MLHFHNHLDYGAVPNRKLQACDKRIPQSSFTIEKLAERKGFSSVFRYFANAFRRRGRHIDGRKQARIAIDCPP